MERLSCMGHSDYRGRLLRGLGHGGIPKQRPKQVKGHLTWVPQTFIFPVPTCTNPNHRSPITTTPSSLAERFRLDGRVAVVTGASGQLGQAISRGLADLGASLALVDIDPARAEDLASELGSASHRAFGADLTNKGKVGELASQIGDHFGRVDILVNNAGIGVFTPSDQRTEAEFTSVIDINLGGTFHCIDAFREQLAKGGGSIVNIASVYGIVSPDPRVYGDSGRNSSEIYGATKAGVVQMSKYFAVHLAPLGIRVNSISPGGVFANQAKEFVDAYVHRTPMARMAEAQDIQGAVAFLASDAAGYVTGHNLVVDGGFSAW
jgi:NAD(P)-dependent dehydrogenase (short-subunit alcohol dehydrogenase family)